MDRSEFLFYTFNLVDFNFDCDGYRLTRCTAVHVFEGDLRSVRCQVDCINKKTRCSMRSCLLLNEKRKRRISWSRTEA